uniref:Uncharacterized protein LOC105852341 n=1 Tax=Cicer arietinum TaxID=3827 RepID=A0A1S3EBU8_CICAR|nr:uncharacterized protein LOC105852341 [Cicer arietinum]
MATAMAQQAQQAANQWNMPPTYWLVKLNTGGGGEKNNGRKPRICGLGSLQEKFFGQIFSKSVRVEKEDQFLRLYQGSLTASEYATKFESIAKHFRYFRNQMDEEYMCERFESELKYEIKEFVGPFDIRQYQVMVEKCKKVEIMKWGRPNKGAIGGLARPQGNVDPKNRGRQFQQQKPYAHPQGIARDRPGPQNMGYQRPQNPVHNTMRIVRCYHCEQEGHRITECPERTRICYACKKPGHLAKDFGEKDTSDNKEVVNKKDVVCPTARGHVYHISGEEAPSSSELI